MLGGSPQLLDERIVGHSVVDSLMFSCLLLLQGEVVLLLLDGFVADEEHRLLCQFVFKFEFHYEAFFVLQVTYRHQLGSLHRLILQLHFDDFCEFLLVFEGFSVSLFQARGVKTGHLFVDVLVFLLNRGLDLINLTLYGFYGAICRFPFVNIL